MAAASHSPNAVPITDLDGLLEYLVQGPMKIEASFRIPREGTYRLWLGGNVDRPLRIVVDGRDVSAPTQIYGGDDNKYVAATLALRAGTHNLKLLRGGGGLGPGDNASTVVDGVELEPLSAENERLVTVAPTAWRSLCGRSLDWIEVG
jgi:hypothetical protein